MEESFGFNLKRQIGTQHTGKDLLRSLHQTLGPASLLRFEGVHLNRQLRRALNIRQIQELPAAQLGAIGKVRIFGEGVVLPAAGVFDGAAAPDPGGAIEIEKPAAAGARAMLDDEMAIEQNA